MCVFRSLRVKWTGHMIKKAISNSADRPDNYELSNEFI